MQKICEYCGKTFETKSRKQKLCSNECRKLSKSFKLKNLGKNFFENRRLKIKQSRWTEESRKKTSIASKRQWQCRETKEKQKQSLIKTLSSAYSRNKKSELQKKRWQSIDKDSIAVKRPEIKAKICQTLDNKYGRGHWPCNSKEARKKAVATARKNNSWQRAREKGFATISQKPIKEIFSSNAEQEIKDYIISLGFNVQKTYIKGMASSGEIDIFIPEKNIGIEYDGCYWHSAKFKDKYYHQKKTLLAKEQGISLIHIWEDLWHTNKDIIKSILSARLGIIGNKLFARNCVIRNIDIETYKNFCIKNHIQGYRQASVRLGLFHNGNLIQIASFSKSKNNDFEWEWVRGCPASNNLTIGGTSKLFKHFLNIYNPKSVLCYADMNLFDGHGYEKCGFVLENITVPDKFYTYNNKRIMRNPAKYSEYMEKVRQNHLLLCYGAGNYKFAWYKK